MTVQTVVVLVGLGWALRAAFTDRHAWARWVRECRNDRTPPQPHQHRVVPVSQPLHARLRWRYRCTGCPAMWTEHPELTGD